MHSSRRRGDLPPPIIPSTRHSWKLAGVWIRKSTALWLQAKGTCSDAPRKPGAGEIDERPRTAPFGFVCQPYLDRSISGRTANSFVAVIHRLYGRRQNSTRDFLRPAPRLLPLRTDEELPFFFVFRSVTAPISQWSFSRHNAARSRQR